VFQAFSIEAPPRVAALRQMAVEEKRKQKKEKDQGEKVAGGILTTAHLEQKKRKLGMKSGGPCKRSRTAELLFGSSSPLNAKGDFEDAADVEVSALAVSPVTSAPPPSVNPKAPSNCSGGLLSLDDSNKEAESNEDGGGHIDIVGSPVMGAKAHGLVVAERVLSPRKAPSRSRRSSSSSSSSRDSGKKISSMEEDLPVVHASVKASHSSSKSNGYFVSQEDPIAAAAELGASGTKLIIGNVVRSLRFESQDRERGFLSQAGASFCIPLMETESMKSGVLNMLQYAQDLALKSFVATRCTAWQLRAEASSSSCMIELEERIVVLEHEKLELQKAFEAKEMQLATARAEANIARAEADAALDLKNKYSKELALTQVRLELAEARAGKIEKKHSKS
jgi:hypothetical protein